ncbi:translation initiation factor 2 [Actinoplanes sp. TBRC 11911]|uniref:translation initiation factor 2 n=1 Tax=Actinoplanes sp. TBRC 11911 TaxID=2729386 RepID=UPI00145DF190|nr:translation initiation factor 2 [Actinoplanes sp. TBRC 11911]NMO50559.1 translation initiation factor 2 [Actinoplanes sp. TBRC 11911]
MSDKFFLSPPGGEMLGPGERVLWSGNCAVAEYAFELPASLPRWTLGEETEIAVTDERVIYRDATTLGTGELRWVWPQHIRVQPGSRDSGRSATATQIQLVCAGPDETFPALVFAGGDLATVGDADRLANLLRQAIARYRVEHADDLGVTAAEARVLSRLVIGPEFSNYQGGEGQTVTLLGALHIQEPPRPVPALPVLLEPGPVLLEPVPARVEPALSEPASASRGPDDSGETTVALRWNSPGVPRQHHPDPVELASRAADLAARVAELVSEANSLEWETRNLSPYAAPAAEPPAAEPPPSRAEAARRTAARMAGNAPRGRGLLSQRRSDDAPRGR